MKYILLFFHLLFGVTAAHGQVENPSEKVVITVERTRTEIRTDENGVLHVNVSPNDALEFKARGAVRYSE